MMVCQFGGPSFLQRSGFEVSDSATSWPPLQVTNMPENIQVKDPYVWLCKYQNLQKSELRRSRTSAHQKYLQKVGK